MAGPAQAGRLPQPPRTLTTAISVSGTAGGIPEPARRWPTFGSPPRRSNTPARSYFLFHGALREAEIWGGGAPADAGIWDRTRVLTGRRARVRLAV